MGFWSAIGGIMKGGWSLGSKPLILFMTNKKARRIMAICFFLILFFYISARESIEQRTPIPLLRDFVSTIADNDEAINIEVNKIVEIENPSIWKRIWSFITIYGHLYIIIMLTVMFYYLFRWQNQSKGLRNVLLAILVVFIILQILGSFILIAVENEGNFFEDIKYVANQNKDKPFIPLLKTINPINGILNFAMHIDIWVDPIANIIIKFKHPLDKEELVINDTPNLNYSIVNNSNVSNN